LSARASTGVSVNPTELTCDVAKKNTAPSGHGSVRQRQKQNPAGA
jgi:hypothetical protein